MSTPAKKKCFVIMPISTPESALERYGNDSSHFPHIFEHLFKPALEALDIEAIPPSTVGAEIIHGEIIRNIESADLTLCDISTLNANVFFELGIRTAINKSVIIVRDSHTAKVPFDTAIINTYTYEPDLRPWVLKTQVEALKTHISNCLAKGDKGNAMWKYFSLSMTGKPLEAATGIEGKIEALTLQINALRKTVEINTDSTPVNAPITIISTPNSARSKEFTYTLKVLPKSSKDIEIKQFTENIPGITRASYQRSGNEAKLVLGGKEGLIDSIEDYLAKIGVFVIAIEIK